MQLTRFGELICSSTLSQWHSS